MQYGVAISTQHFALGYFLQNSFFAPSIMDGIGYFHILFLRV